MSSVLQVFEVHLTRTSLAKTMHHQLSNSVHLNKHYRLALEQGIKPSLLELLSVDAGMYVDRISS